LLYFTKGKPNVFKRIRTPIEVCRHCRREIKDYGGHRVALNPNGVSLKDIWTDIAPVRHWKFKDKKRAANALSTKLVSRAILMSTNKGDIVLDPFGGSGTTYDCCEFLKRLWIGIEIDYVDEIVSRLMMKNIEYHKSNDYVEEK
jgi:site-specific DNA-methyltransferase (adenine-specific)